MESIKVSLTFDTGEKTCAIAPGNFCQFVRSKGFGQRFHCHLFEVALDEADGWLLRCDRCLQLGDVANAINNQ